MSEIENDMVSQGCGTDHSGSRDEPAVGATAALAPEIAKIVRRLRAPLIICPYDPLSPEYLTTDNDAPCKFCGQLNDPATPDVCRGGDLRVMEDAAKLLEAMSRPSSPWRTIYSAPLGRDFLAKNAKGDIRRCWRHKPSSRTDDILTFARNGKFLAIAWMELPQ